MARHASSGRRTHAPTSRASGIQRILHVVVSLGVVAAWWAFLAPTNIGGNTAYIMVEGRSMEPLLYGGDLAITREQAHYDLGDLVVVRVKIGGSTSQVIHRLRSGSEAIGWKTQGDNNPKPDAWTVTNRQIVGKYWTGIPGFGHVLNWTLHNPILFAGLAALLALVPYLPRHRRRLTPALRAALDQSTRERRGQGHSGTEVAVLALTSCTAVICLGLAGLMGVGHRLASVSGIVVMVAFAWSVGLAVYFAYRVFDGRGAIEPARSTAALSGRLRLVDQMPAVHEVPTDVQSPVQLRTVAEKYRLPILHRIDPETDEHMFLVITAGRGIYRWRTSAPKPPQHSADPNLTLDPAMTTNSEGRPQHHLVEA